MKVFVTGGTGLVGSHVIERLRSRGYPTVALVRDSAGARQVELLGATSVRGKVEDPGSWRGANDCQAIVHSAAIITKQEPWEELPNDVRPVLEEMLADVTVTIDRIAGKQVEIRRCRVT